MPILSLLIENITVRDLYSYYQIMFTFLRLGADEVQIITEWVKSAERLLIIANNQWPYAVDVNWSVLI